MMNTLRKYLLRRKSTDQQLADEVRRTAAEYSAATKAAAKAGLNVHADHLWEYVYQTSCGYYRLCNLRIKRYSQETF